MGEPCACIPFSLVAMSLIDGLRSSSRGVVVGQTMDSVARMVVIIDIDPPEVLTGSPAQQRHFWQQGLAFAGTADRISLYNTSLHVVAVSPLLIAASRR